ncbi:MAG: hypothetical protein ACTSPS_08200 [Promethearchaeota archaeon]
MVLLAQTMDIARFIQIFLVQGLAGLFFLFIAYRILKREKKGLNLILSSFYICVAFAVIINVVYAFIFVEEVVYILHITTYYLLCFPLIFLLVFVLILLKSEEVITPKIQTLLVVGFGILLVGLWLIPNGVTINESTNWKPDWSWIYLFYSFTVCSLFAIFPTIYLSIKLYLKFEYKELKKKLKYFLVGISGYFFLYFGTSISNTLNDPTIRLIWSLLSLPTLISLYFVYFGVAKNL